MEEMGLISGIKESNNYPLLNHYVEYKGLLKKSQET